MGITTAINLGAVDLESIHDRVIFKSKTGRCNFHWVFGIDGKCNDWLTRISIVVVVRQLTCLRKVVTFEIA